MDEFFEDSGKASAPAKPTATRKPRSKKNQDNNDISIGNIMNNCPGVPKRARAPRGQKLEDFAQQTNRESVLANPDTYIISVHKLKIPYWLFDGKIMKKIKADIPIGLGRLFIEIIANACDNATRCYENGVDPGTIEVTVANDVVTIKNYGLPMPVIWNEENKMWTPEWILTTMLTSSNYKKQRHGGGKNGMGAKIVGFMSHDSWVKIFDHLEHKMFYQSWSNGLLTTTCQQVYPYDGTSSSTEFSYRANLDIFGYPEQRYPDLAYNLFARMAADASFTCKIPVVYNGMVMNYGSILEYANLYVQNVKNYVLFYKWGKDSETGNDITVKTAKDGSQMCATNTNVPDIEMIILDTPGFGLQLGLCNSLVTVDGGIHVDAAIKYISSIIKDAIGMRKTKTGKTKVKTEDELTKEKSARAATKKAITNNISIIINVRLPDPSLSGQSKSYLSGFVADRETKTMGKFVLEPPDNLKTKIQTWDLTRNMEKEYDDYIKKTIEGLKAKNGKRVKGTHTEDCEWATKVSTRKDVMALFFEGESAKAYARCVRTFLPNGAQSLILISLGGKINNVIKSSKNIDLLVNTLFMEIIKVCGLTPAMDYMVTDNIKTLRSQKGFMIMTDQDADGLHIKMLLLSFFYKYFPSLLTVGFFYDWRTKLISASRNNYKTLKFYYTRQYDEWAIILPPGELEKWTIKYYKGLGTSSEKDARADVEEPWVVRLFWDPDANKFLELTMSGGNSAGVKEWMANFDVTKQPDPIINNEQKVSSFINDEFITYCTYTLGRHLPSFSDGLNDTRRKIIHYAFKNKKWKNMTACSDKTVVRLDIFSNAAMAETHYHHGDLCKVVANQTQMIIGGNNVSDFNADGQFGTRFSGGKDCASSRYPKLSARAPWLNAVYRREDLRLLKYMKDEGESIEPTNYFPVISSVLVNGWRGIAFGHSSWIPAHHPLKIVEMLLDILKGAKFEDLPALHPWYRGFKGTIDVLDSRAVAEVTYNMWEDYDVEEEEKVDVTVGKYTMVSRGIATGNPMSSLRITELPVGVWTTPYMEKVLDVLEEKKLISGYQPNSDIYNVDITINGLAFKDSEGNPRAATPEDLGLVRSYGLGNMKMLDSDNKPIKYESAKHILYSYFLYRIKFYYLRKELKLKEKVVELERANAKAKYISAVNCGVLEFKGVNKKARTPEDILADVRKLGLSEEIHSVMKATRFSDKGLADAEVTINRIIADSLTIQNTKPETMFYEDLLNVANVYIEIFGDDRPVGNSGRSGGSSSEGITATTIMSEMAY